MDAGCRQAREQGAHERGAHPRLRHDRRPRRPGQAPVEPVDEHDVQYDVDDVRHHHDHERRAQIRHTAQVALAGQRDQREGQPQRADPQVLHGQLAGAPLGAHQVHQRHGEGPEECREDQTDASGEPQRLGRDPAGIDLVAGSLKPRDLGGRPVGEEVEERERSRQKRGGDRQRRELLRAEVADHRRVHQQVEGLGGQCAERGQRQPEDLAVVG